MLQLSGFDSVVTLILFDFYSTEDRVRYAPEVIQLRRDFLYSSNEDPLGFHMITSGTARIVYSNMLAHGRARVRRYGNRHFITSPINPGIRGSCVTDDAHCYLNCLLSYSNTGYRDLCWMAHHWGIFGYEAQIVVRIRGLQDGLTHRFRRYRASSDLLAPLDMFGSFADGRLANFAPW